MLQHLINKQQPNIILIITDQQRWDAIGYINNKIITPNLDKLAKQSIICTNAFTQSPQCQPSRAAFLTGRYPNTLKMWWNETSLDPSELTIGNYLKNQGYLTSYFGKLHLSENKTHNFGFEHTYLLEDWQQSRHITKQVAKEFYKPMSTKTWTGIINDRTGHHDEVIINEAIAWIKKQSKSFFTVISFHGPHPPYIAPKEFNALYNLDDFSNSSKSERNLSNDEWKNLKLQYYSAISWIDDNLGRLFKIVDIDNTIIIYLSDHGDMLGEHDLFSKGLYAYDGNVKIPLLIKIPGLSAIKYNYLIQTIDIVPTILSFLKFEIDMRIQGTNLLHSLINNIPKNQYIISMIGYHQRLRMIRTMNWKYWIVGNKEYLFDLENDKDENNNLFNTKPEKLNRMRYLLLKALIKTEDIIPRPLSQ